MHYLQEHPLFPKDSRGIVRSQRVPQLLRNPVHAGYVEAPSWGLSRREGQHEGLISYSTFRRIQDKLDSKSTEARRRNRNEDFPLRGHVLGADCSSPLTGAGRAVMVAATPITSVRNAGAPATASRSGARRWKATSRIVQPHERSSASHGAWCAHGGTTCSPMVTTRRRR